MQALVNSIPSTRTDELLRAQGYDLLDEYDNIILKAGFDSSFPVLELATGTGRTAAILARHGFRVFTGDIVLEKKAEALSRITPGYYNRVSMIALDMERLPFRDNSVNSIISLNTVHELHHPEECFEELIRIHHPAGTLVVGDYNEEGFAVLQKIHSNLFGRDHSRGHLPIQALKTVLRREYRRITTIQTNLNNSFICTGKVPV
jgi:ubiquinone/menaquinone biosynthesis C-methylase UbiE